VFRRHPAIQTAYEFKEELCTLLSMKERNRINCVPLLKRLQEMVGQMIYEAPEIFKKLGRTIRQWFEPIIRMWRFTKSNGITEGFHRKMKLIRLFVIKCGHVPFPE
jgi:transposase